MRFQFPVNLFWLAVKSHVLGYLLRLWSQVRTCFMQTSNLHVSFRRWLFFCLKILVYGFRNGSNRLFRSSLRLQSSRVRFLEITAVSAEKNFIGCFIYNCNLFCIRSKSREVHQNIWRETKNCWEVGEARKNWFPSGSRKTRLSYKIFASQTSNSRRSVMQARQPCFGILSKICSRPCFRGRWEWSEKTTSGQQMGQKSYIRH